MTEMTFDHGGVHRRQTTGFSWDADAGLSVASTATLTVSIFAVTLAGLSRLAAACRARREKLVDQAMRRSNWFE
jgi:hypothetical protein